MLIRGQRREQIGRSGHRPLEDLLERGLGPVLDEGRLAVGDELVEGRWLRGAPFGCAELADDGAGVEPATPFVPAGKRLYCSNACNAAAYRRRKQATPPVVVPRARPRRPITIYECETCDTRALGEQRCADCGTFMRRIGYGGHCPSCAEPVAVADLLGEEASP